MLLDEARISAQDRGFLFGDAVYEVIRVYQGRPWLLDQHSERLANSLAAVRIEGINLPQLQERILETIREGEFQDASVYIQITRGTATRNHAFPKGVEPLEFFYVTETPNAYLEHRKVGIAVVTYPDLRWKRCDIKSTNLLGSVLASQAAAEAGATEAILYDSDGLVTEGSHSTLFAVDRDGLRTTKQDSTILPGITRQFVMELAQKESLVVREESIPLTEVTDMPELFLTGTGYEIMPVVRVDEKVIGDAQPGPVTQRLQRAYASAVETWLGTT